MKGDVKRAHDLAGELRVVIGRMRRRLLEQSQIGDLTSSQLTVLRVLNDEGASTVTSLARVQGMRSQSMGAIVAALETAGLITGAPDPSDGRQTLWSLTSECRERVRAGRAAKEDWLFQAMQKNLSSDELSRLADTVALLKRLSQS